MGIRVSNRFWCQCQTSTVSRNSQELSWDWNCRSLRSSSWVLSLVVLASDFRLPPDPKFSNVPLSRERWDGRTSKSFFVALMVMFGSSLKFQAIFNPLRRMAATIWALPPSCVYAIGDEMGRLPWPFFCHSRPCSLLWLPSLLSGTCTEGSNFHSEFVQRLEAVCAGKWDILEQRSGQRVSRRVILRTVLEILNDIGLDASLRGTVEFNWP